MTRMILMTGMFLIAYCGNTIKGKQTESEGSSTKVETVKNEQLLDGIQSKIYQALGQSMVARNSDSLLVLSQKLDDLYHWKKNKLILYWQAYLQFYTSIYHLKTRNEKLAEKSIDKGVDILKEMKNKNSEDYALLAMLQSFSIRFKGMKAPVISANVKKNAKLAISMDSLNLRAYYVYGSNDFHTPEKYGGGKEVEKYMLKAISLSDQKIKNNYLPSWGKEEAYETLIKFYIKKENRTAAKKYFDEAMSSYPQSYTIRQLGEKLNAK